jgi:hypothetical protein
VGGAGDVFAWNAGAQADYETRRIYASLKTDYHDSSAFSHRIDTLQLGLAPYEHDYESLATWFVVQGRRYTGEIHDGTEWAFLVSGLLYAFAAVAFAVGVVFAFVLPGF